MSRSNTPSPTGGGTGGLPGHPSGRRGHCLRGHGRDIGHLGHLGERQGGHCSGRWDPKNAVRNGARWGVLDGIYREKWGVYHEKIGILEVFLWEWWFWHVLTWFNHEKLRLCRALTMRNWFYYMVVVSKPWWRVIEKGPTFIVISPQQVMFAGWL